LPPGGARLPHEGAGDADIDGVFDPLPCPLDELEAFGYQGAGDER